MDILSTRQVQLVEKLQLSNLHIAALLGDLHLASLPEDPEPTRQLPVLSRDIDCRDVNGATPLMLAALLGHFAVVIRLVGRGADYAATDHNGRSAKAYAEASLEMRQKRILLQKLGFPCRSAQRIQSVCRCLTVLPRRLLCSERADHPLAGTYFDRTKPRSLAIVRVKIQGCPVRMSRLPENATIGFISGRGMKHPQVWAVSGWAPGLKVEPGVLDRAKYFRYVREFAGILGFKLPNHLFDSAGRRRKPEHHGRHNACHVEKFLTTYWVRNLMKKLLGSRDLHSVGQLKEVALEDNQRHAFVFLDRIPCYNCMDYVSAVEQASGLEFTLAMRKDLYALSRKEYMNLHSHTAKRKVEYSQDLDNLHQTHPQKGGPRLVHASPSTSEKKDDDGESESGDAEGVESRDECGDENGDDKTELGSPPRASRENAARLSSAYEAGQMPVETMGGRKRKVTPIPNDPSISSFQPDDTPKTRISSNPDYTPPPKRQNSGGTSIKKPYPVHIQRSPPSQHNSTEAASSYRTYNAASRDFFLRRADNIRSQPPANEQRLESPTLATKAGQRADFAGGWLRRQPVTPPPPNRDGEESSSWKSNSSAREESHFFETVEKDDQSPPSQEERNAAPAPTDVEPHIHDRNHAMANIQKYYKTGGKSRYNRRVRYVPASRYKKDPSQHPIPRPHDKEISSAIRWSPIAVSQDNVTPERARDAAETHTQLSLAVEIPRSPEQHGSQPRPPSAANQSKASSTQTARQPRADSRSPAAPPGPPRLDTHPRQTTGPDQPKTRVPNNLYIGPSLFARLARRNFPVAAAADDDDKIINRNAAPAGPSASVALLRERISPMKYGGGVCGGREGEQQPPRDGEVCSPADGGLVNIEAQAAGDVEGVPRDADDAAESSSRDEEAGPSSQHTDTNLAPMGSQENPIDLD